MMFYTIVALLVLAWIYTLQTKIDRLQEQINTIDRLLQGGERSKQEVSVELPNISEDMASDSSSGEAEQIESATEEQKREPTYTTQEQAPSKLTTWIVEYFTHGNILVRIGGVILFFGLAFLVKYAAQHSDISMEVRLISVSLIAVALIVLGWILRKRSGGYGLILQGLGVALLYLVIYGAAKFFSLLSLDSAFILMFAVVIVGSLLSVIEDALPLALFSTMAGFLVPILTSSGDGSHVVLFSYYALLNVGIFLMAWYRSWRVLNLSGFIFTFVIATVWGVLRYDDTLFATTEPFLILYFVMYLVIAILFTFKHTFRPRNFVDASLVFGLPLVAFALQLELVEHIANADALSALSLGLLYTLLWVSLRQSQRGALLARSFLVLGMIFYTLTIFYYFDRDVAASLWALESAAIIWLSLKQSTIVSRIFGELLLVIALLTYPFSLGGYESTAFLNTEYLGDLIVIISALFSAYLLDRYIQMLHTLEKRFAIFYIVVATLLLIVAGTKEISKFNIIEFNGMLIYLAATTLLMASASYFVQWQRVLGLLQYYFSLGAFFILGLLVSDRYYISPLSGIGAYALLSFFGVHYALLHFIGKEWRSYLHLHIASLWMITLLASLELYYRIDLWFYKFLGEMKASDLSIVRENWHAASLVLAPLLIAGLILISKRFPSYYKSWGVGGIVFTLFVWVLLSFDLSASFALFEYRPIVNPLDALEMVSLFLIGYWAWVHRDRFSQAWRTLLGSTMAIMLTLLSSVILARAVYHFRGIEYHLCTLWESLFFQVGLSVLWSILAIVLMLLSMRYKSRPVWIFGFALLIIVVLKLFVIELASSGTIERIVSFIVVGTLLLLVGYFAPLPPTNHQPPQETL